MHLFLHSNLSYRGWVNVKEIIFSAIHIKTSPKNYSDSSNNGIGIFFLFRVLKGLCISLYQLSSPFLSVNAWFAALTNLSFVSAEDYMIPSFTDKLLNVREDSSIQPYFRRSEENKHLEPVLAKMDENLFKQKNVTLNQISYY